MTVLRLLAFIAPLSPGLVLGAWVSDRLRENAERTTAVALIILGAGLAVTHLAQSS